MKLAIMAIVFSSLVWYEGRDGEEANIVGQGKKHLPYLEKNKLLLFPKQIFCWPSAVFWISETPWGYYLTALAGLVLWLTVEMWTKSCLATLQKKRAAQPTVPVEAEPESEMDLELPEQTRNFCACGTQTSGFESHKPRPETYAFQAPQDRGRSQRYETTLYSDSWRRRLPASYSQHDLNDVSSSSYLSSSSSSSCSSLCLPCLKHLDLRCAMESPPVLTDSAEAILSSFPCNEPEPSISLEKADAVSCLDVADAAAIKDGADGAAMSLLMFAERMEMPPPFPEENEPQLLPTFAQINILQSLRNEDNVVLVAKSLAFCMGKVPPPPPAPTPVPVVQVKEEEEKREEEEEKEKREEEEEPTKVSSEDEKPSQPKEPISAQEKNICPKPSHDASLQKLYFSVSGTILRAPWKARPRARSDMASEAYVVPLSYPLENVGEEATHVLEFHVKKKMIQKQFGFPTAVIRSLKAFQALASSLPKALVGASGPRTPKPKWPLALTDTRRRSLLLLSQCFKPVALAASLVCKIPSKKKYSILYSIDPEEIQRLAFHARVKMLEIKMGTFPDIVEKSFLIFKILSEQPLPKLIRCGNKIQRLKDPSLSFLASEALCIIDLNVKHKCLVGTRRLSAQDMKAIWVSEELRDLEGDLETCLKGAGPSFGELRRSAFESLGPPNQRGSLAFLGRQAHTTRPPICRQVHFQESVLLASYYKEQVPCPGLRTPGPASQGSSYQIPSSLATARTTSSSSSLLGSPTPGSYSSMMICTEPRLLEGSPKKPCIPPTRSSPKVDMTVSFLGLKERPQKSSMMTPSSSESSEFEAEARRQTSQRPHISQDLSRPGLGEQPIVSGSPSHLVCSQLVTKTSRSFESRESEDDGLRKGISKIHLSREMHFREVSILESFRKENAPDSGLRELPTYPVSPGPSSSVSSTLVNTKKLSEVYLKYVASTQSTSSVAQKLSQQKALGIGAKVESKDVRTGIGGKGIGMAGEAKADGKGTKAEPGLEGDGMEGEDGPIKRTSIFLELELKKQQLNLLLKKRLQAHLQPPQRAAIELSVDVGKEPTDSRKAKAPAAYQPRPSDTEARGKRRRPFCYVCMPVDNTGSVVKTVCWSLPKWILEMNGNRVPQVARFEKRTKGPASAAK